MDDNIVYGVDALQMEDFFCKDFREKSSFIEMLVKALEHVLEWPYVDGEGRAPIIAASIGHARILCGSKMSKEELEVALFEIKNLAEKFEKEGWKVMILSKVSQVLSDYNKTFVT